jgi:hypothetical protein
MAEFPVHKWNFKLRGGCPHRNGQKGKFKETEFLSGSGRKLSLP